MRLSVGAVQVLSGNMKYFDTASQVIGPDHVMASGALPPGFPPVEIDGQPYWDGGLVSNTPLDYVLPLAFSVMRSPAALAFSTCCDTTSVG